MVHGSCAYYTHTACRADCAETPFSLEELEKFGLFRVCCPNRAPGTRSMWSAAAEGGRRFIRPTGDAALAHGERRCLRKPRRACLLPVLPSGGSQSGVDGRPDKASASLCRRTPHWSGASTLDTAPVHDLETHGFVLEARSWIFSAVSTSPCVLKPTATVRPAFRSLNFRALSPSRMTVFSVTRIFMPLTTR